MAWTFSSRQSMSSALMAVEDDEEEMDLAADEEGETEILPVSGSVEDEDQELEEEVVLA